MPPDHDDPTPIQNWLERTFGRGVLPPPRLTVALGPGAAEELAEIEWVVRGMELTERIGEPYALELRLLARDAEVEPEALLGVRVELSIERGTLVRTVLGVVLAAELTGAHGEGARVTLQVGPALALLGLARRSRVFQGRRVPEIVEAVVGPVLLEHGGALDGSKLSRVYPPRDYCVQYRETDLDFVLRLLADEGIGLLFHHEGEAETVVLADDNASLAPAGLEPLASSEGDGLPLLPLLAERLDDVPVESLHGAGQRSQMTRGQWHSVAWDWKQRPAVRLRSSQAVDGGPKRGGWWDVDEHRPDEDAGSSGPIADDTARRVTLFARRDDAEATVLRATSNATVLRAGSVFELATPQGGYDDAWVVTAARHRAEVPAASLHGSNADLEPVFENEIVCQPLARAVRPPLRPRPRVHGLHTAIVTGPEGESIHTDAYGRVRVRFVWDDGPHEGEETSCWLRVAQPWAGDGFGTVFIPRVGSEVLVTFVDGDPDRPLCTGSVYAGAAMPPYLLPEHRSRTVLRTACLDGDGHNELSFEDGDGREEIYLHAHRNLCEEVGASHATRVGGAQRLTVGGARTTSIGKDDELTIEGDHRHTVDGDVALCFHSGLQMRVSGAPKPEASKGVEITVERGTYTVDVADGIELRCGECRIVLSPSRIMLEGPMVVARSTEGYQRERSTLSLTGSSAELRADQAVVDTGASRLLLDDRVMLTQGPEGNAEARLDLRGGEATLDGKARSCVSGAKVSLDAEGLAEVSAHDLRLRAASLVAETKGDLDLEAAGECRVRGAKIRLN